MLGQLNISSDSLSYWELRSSRTSSVIMPVNKRPLFETFLLVMEFTAGTTSGAVMGKS